MTKDLKDLVDNIHQLAMNSRDISAVSRMVGTIHAVDEALLVLTRERDEARREICERCVHQQHDPQRYASDRGWDCFKEEEMACDTLSQEVSQEGSKLPTTISSNGICITEYIPPQNSVREIPPYGAYTTGECTLSVHTIKETQ